MTQTNTHTEVSPTTLPELCLTALRLRARSDVLNHKQGGEWQHISADAMARRVRAIALGLEELGLSKGDRVALLSENRPEWSIVDLAILSLGAINVPIYTTQAVEQSEYILSDSGARAMFISNQRLYKHAQPALAQRGLEHLIFFDPEVGELIER